MLRRSIPGYAASIEAIGSLAARYVRPQTNCYDLGCSLGAATLAMHQGIRADGCRIIAVDNSAAMIEKCRTGRGRGIGDIEVQLADIRDVRDRKRFDGCNELHTAVSRSRTRGMRSLRRIADGMVDGGLFLLSEKVVDENAHMEELLVDLHHEHKRRNDYSELEISRKRAALENVLVPGDSGGTSCGAWLNAGFLTQRGVAALTSISFLLSRSNSDAIRLPGALAGCLADLGLANWSWQPRIESL